MTHGFFVVGTDTGVGKTFTTMLIARELAQSGKSVGCYKPVCTGAEYPQSSDQPVWPDVEALRSVCTVDAPIDRVCPQRFLAPLAPPVSAAAEQRLVDARMLSAGVEFWDGHVEFLLVEGVGGILCPLTETDFVADLAGELGFPVIIVGRLGLGTINHTLLTIEAADRRKLPVVGLILCEVTPAAGDASAATNAAEIEARTDVPVLGVIPHGAAGGLLHRGGIIRMDWAALVRGIVRHL